MFDTPTRIPTWTTNASTKSQLVSADDREPQKGKDDGRYSPSDTSHLQWPY